MVIDPGDDAGESSKVIHATKLRVTAIRSLRITLAIMSGDFVDSRKGPARLFECKPGRTWSLSHADAAEAWIGWKPQKKVESR